MSIIIHFNTATFIPSSVTLPSAPSCISSKVKRKLAMVPGIDQTDRTVMTDDESSMVEIATSNTLYTHSVNDIKSNHVLGSCFGLPYQDHNYGAPPPPTPPSYSPCASPAHANGVPDEETDLPVVSASTASEGTQEGSITRCICGFEQDDEYMICCDACLVWQHVDCMGLDRNNIPETYMCEKCQPRKVDRHKAKVLQKRKKVAITDSSDTDEDREVKNSEKRTKTRNKRRRKEEEKSEKSEHGTGRRSRNMHKHKERIEAKRSKLRRTKNKESTSTADEEAQDAWDISLEWCEKNFETAITNQYTPEVQQLARSLPLQVHEKKLMELLLTRNCSVLEGNQKRLISIYDIPRDQPLIEYVGKFLLASQFYELHPAFSKRLFPFVLFYTLDPEEICVDATVYGNEARFVRRSCKPNAELHHLVHNGNLHVYISSTRAVFKDDEITLPLDFNLKESIKEIECACESDDCILKFHQKNGSVDISHEKRRRGRKLTFSADDDSSHSFAGLNASPTKSKPSPGKSNSQTSEHADGKFDHETEEQANERKKKTREERKIDAIMKAFDQMEKAAKRRQQALERHKSHNPKSEESSEKPESAQTPKEEDKVTTASGSETQGGEEEKVRVQTPKPKKGKRRRGSGSASRRRTRTNSGGSDILSPEENVPASSAPATSTLNSDTTADADTSVETLNAATACATVPTVIPVAAAPVTSPVVLKTKRFLLHEWLQEKSETAPPTPPACVRPEVKWSAVSTPTRYVQCTKDNPHSAGISAAHMRRSSTSGPIKSCSEQGSAKKRWLRQAMYDCNTYDDPLTIDTGGMEGLHFENGYFSPNGHVELGSPGGADDTVTPLKKRRLLRESLDCTSSPLSPSCHNSESVFPLLSSVSPESKTEPVINDSEQQLTATKGVSPSSADLLTKSKEDVKINGLVGKCVESLQKPNSKEEESTPDTSVSISLSLESKPTLTAIVLPECSTEVEQSTMQTDCDLAENGVKNGGVQGCDNLDGTLQSVFTDNALNLCSDNKHSEPPCCDGDDVQSNLPQTPANSTPSKVQSTSEKSTTLQTSGVKRKIIFPHYRCSSTLLSISPVVDNKASSNLSDILEVSASEVEMTSSCVRVEHSPSKSENVNKVLSDNISILPVNSECTKDSFSDHPVSPCSNLLYSPPAASPPVEDGVAPPDCEKGATDCIVDVPKKILTDVTIAAEGTELCCDSLSSEHVVSIHEKPSDDFSHSDPQCSHLCCESSTLTTKVACSSRQKRKVSLSEYRMRMKDVPGKRSNCEAIKRSVSSPAISATAIPVTLPEHVTLAPLPLFNKSPPLSAPPLKAPKKKKEVVKIVEEPCEVVEPRENLTERLKREFGFDEDSGDCILTSATSKSTSSGGTSSALPASAQPPPPPPPKRPSQIKTAATAAVPPTQIGFPLPTTYARPSYIVPQVPSAQFIPVQPPITAAVVPSTHPVASPGVQCSVRSSILPPPHSFVPSLLPGNAIRPPLVQHEYPSVNAQSYAALVQQIPPPPPPKSYPPHTYQPGLYK